MQFTLFWMTLGLSWCVRCGWGASDGYNDIVLAKRAEPLPVSERLDPRHTVQITKRADIEKSAVFADQKRAFEEALGQINRYIEKLFVVVGNEAVEFRKFRDGFDAYQAELIALVDLVLHTTYNQPELHRKLEQAQLVFNSLNEGSGFDHACENDGEWIDCSLADVFELRITLAYSFNEFGGSPQAISDRGQRVEEAKEQLLDVAQTARALHELFWKKWQVFEAALILSKDLVDAMADERG
ncbi:hypothetical protein JCM33374_g5296 [Metschnikowia sp. JCM 33374]|nr:hypothetical protein JCM33374_g5296 [Metschnikowia sp. JCM 33374]